MLKINLKKDVRYALCTCNKSAKYPFCDGAHRNYNMLNKTNYKSMKIIPKNDTTLIMNP